ncbi:hypothetical protein SDJN02_23597, partial [Cucurbita argyrosperma subsp. argyrosperma]
MKRLWEIARLILQVHVPGDSNAVKIRIFRAGNSEEEEDERVQIGWGYDPFGQHSGFAPQNSYYQVLCWFVFLL